MRIRVFETALENLSKEDLLKVISSRDEKIGYLESQLALYKRMQFGQKRERFEGDPNQTELPFEAEPVEVEQQEAKQKIEYIGKRPNHKWRAKLPEHLPVIEKHINPEGDLSEMVCIGKGSPRNWNLNLPNSTSTAIYIRYKYAAKNGGACPEPVSGALRSLNSPSVSLTKASPEQACWR